MFRQKKKQHSSRATIESCPLPDGAVLGKYAGSPSGNSARNYTDSYSTRIPGVVSLSQFVFAFYTTPLFRLERLILKYLVGKPSTDEQARQLAEGLLDSFAAWNVEQRVPDQLLMSDYRGRTRSWFMVVLQGNADSPQTVLYFGSAVVPNTDEHSSKEGVGGLFRLLLGFHKLYSRLLLCSARFRLRS